MPSLPARAKLITLADDVHRIYEKAMKDMVQALWSAGRRVVEDEEDAEIRAVYGGGFLKELTYMLAERHGGGYSGKRLEKLRAFYLDNKASPDKTAGWNAHFELQPAKDRLEKEGAGNITAGGTGNTAPLARPVDLRLRTYRKTQDDDTGIGDKPGEVPVLLDLDCGFFVCRTVPVEEAARVTVTDTPSYTYAATVEKVVDGDTLRAVIDLGFGATVREKLRLRGINCPELGTPDGEQAKKFVQELLPAGSRVVLHSNKTRTEKYGRFLADIFYLGSDSTAEEIIAGGTYLNQELLDKGHAVSMAG
jgi:endonuclease YncB( thermonuclease family)